MAKKKPVKRKSVKSSTKKRKPTKKRTPTKRTKGKPEEKEKKKGLIGRAVGKIPTSYKVKGGKAKYKSALGESEIEYDEVKVGK